MRKEGFYWVKFVGIWTIGEYDGAINMPWSICGQSEIYHEDMLDEIGSYLGQKPEDSRSPSKKEFSRMWGFANG